MSKPFFHRGASRLNASISRRNFLRGSTAFLALPWLEQLSGTGSKALAQQTMEPRRFLGFFAPNGFNMEMFWPSTVGPLDESQIMGTSLTTLAPHLQKILMIRGLDNHAGASQGDGPGDHARGTSTFLTCVHPRKHESDVLIGPSVDQLLASHYMGQTQFGSIEIGCEGGGNENACDSGYSCAYSRNISWRDARTPNSKETSPRLLFQRLFGVTDPAASPAARANRRRQRRSVLDFVRQDIQRLSADLGSADRQRLDAYLEGVRGIERRIDASEAEAIVCGAGMEQPLGAPEDRAEYAGLMLDILVEAMRCDLTRVGTFMLGNGGSNRAHLEIGINEGHHTLSHHQSVPDTLAKLAQIDQWEIGMLARLLSKMDEVSMGTGTLLDQTTVFFGSGLEDGNRHYHYNLPVILAGRCGGLQPGRFADVAGMQANNEPIANLFLRIMQDAGMSTQTFGDDGVAALSI